MLTKYGSTSITYDMIGNPLTIGEKELAWEGRQLTSLYDGEYITIDYGYNADGIRTFKEVYDADTGDTTRHEYILSGSQIIKETVFVNNVESYTLSPLDAWISSMLRSISSRSLLSVSICLSRDIGIFSNCE